MATRRWRPAWRLPDLVILDVMLPGRSGFDVLRELRATGSAVGGHAPDRPQRRHRSRRGPRAGRRRLRHQALRAPRAGGARGSWSCDASGGRAPAQAPRRYFDLGIDRGAREAMRTGRRSTSRIRVRPARALVAHQGVAWTREQLGDRVRRGVRRPIDRSIDSHVKNLRRKLGERDRRDASTLETVRGVGYRAARPLSLRPRVTAAFALVASPTAGAVSRATPFDRRSRVRPRARGPTRPGSPQGRAGTAPVRWPARMPCRSSRTRWSR